MRKFAAVAALMALVAIPAIASAHATLESSDPEANATVDEAPTEVRLTMAEDPAAGSQVTVTDGCKDEVGGKVQLSGADVIVPISGGEPGRWNVDFDVISAEDGHQIGDSYSFVVAGKKDCSAGTEETPDDIEPTTSSTQPIDNEDDGSSFPVVPLLVGTVVVVGGAFLLRRGTSGS